MNDSKINAFDNSLYISAGDLFPLVYSGFSVTDSVL